MTRLAAAERLLAVRRAKLARAEAYARESYAVSSEDGTDLDALTGYFDADEERSRARRLYAFAEIRVYRFRRG